MTAVNVIKKKKAAIVTYENKLEIHLLQESLMAGWERENVRNQAFNGLWDTNADICIETLHV